MKPITPLISVVALAALATMTYALWEMVGVGTCASGGPYVSARECPAGTGALALLLTGAILVYVIAIIAAAFQSAAAGGFWFGMLFTVLGAMFIAAQVSGQVAEGSGGVGWFLGVLFLAMGILPLLGSIIMMIKAFNNTTDDDGPARFAGPYVVGAELVAPPKR
jgi:hypothetical protein